MAGYPCWLFGAVALVLLALATACGSEEPAEMVVIGGQIHTGDPTRPRAAALAVRRGRFVAVGTEKEIHRITGPSTRIIELGGASVLPGLIDGHVHLDSGLSMTRGVNLYGIASKQRWLEVVAARASELPAGSWILGGRWDHTLLPVAELPTRFDLDMVTPKHPVALNDVDGHTTWANSLALQTAGVTAQTADPPGGTIVRDPQSGEPTGILLETAGSLVGRMVPPMTDSKRLATLVETVRFANSLGLTGIHHMGSVTQLDDLVKLLRDGDLSLRVWFGAIGIGSADLVSLGELRDSVAWEFATNNNNSTAGPMLAVGYVKLWADGVLSAYTAAMLEPYSDAPDERGLPRYENGELAELVTSINAAGFPVAIHAIGDAAVRLSLDAFEAALDTVGPMVHPNRIEHVEVVDPTDVGRFARLGVVASMSPHHCITGIDVYNTLRLGPRRVAMSFAWNTLKQSGATLVFGSDWPTAPLDPMRQLYAAVLREKPAGGPSGGWHPENRVSFDQALTAYSTTAATITAWADDVGSIQPGHWADFVVLNGPIDDQPNYGTFDRRVQATYLGGRIVYRSDLPSR